MSPAALFTGGNTPTGGGIGAQAPAFGDVPYGEAPADTRLFQDVIPKDLRGE